MKKIRIMLGLCLLISIQVFASKPYTTGEFMNVFAYSGLKLRNAPGLFSEAIMVIPFGESVEIIDPLNEPGRYDRIEWLDGKWIKVDYGGVEGFVFDAYLSKLALPFEVEEHCWEDQDLVMPLRRYFENNYQQCEEIHYEESELEVELFAAEGKAWTDLRVEIANIRLSDAVNLLRSMVPVNQRALFEDSLVFKRGRDGTIGEIVSKFSTHPLTIKYSNTGSVVIYGYTAC